MSPSSRYTSTPVSLRSTSLARAAPRLPEWINTASSSDTRGIVRSDRRFSNLGVAPGASLLMLFSRLHRSAYRRDEWESLVCGPGKFEAVLHRHAHPVGIKVFNMKIENSLAKCVFGSMLV